MTNPLKNLKSSMKQSVFKNLSFSEERKQAVKNEIQRNHSHPWEEKTVLSILELLQSKEQNGYEISTLLLQKNDDSFQNNEGQLYTLLHLLENKGMLTSKWIEEQKFYFLTSKGKKYIKVCQQQSSSFKQVEHTDLLEEASL